MDLAYDQILEKSVSKENETTPRASGERKAENEEPTLSAEVQDAYRAFSSSPWGARIGGFIGTVAKQVWVLVILPYPPLPTEPRSCSRDGWRFASFSPPSVDFDRAGTSIVKPSTWVTTPPRASRASATPS